MVKESIRTYLLRAHSLEGLTDDTPLLDGGLLDSLDALELVSFVSENFGISLAPDDMRVENFASITAISTFVDLHLPR